MVARGRGLDHRRGAVGVESREQDRRLHLRRRDRERILDPTQRCRAADGDRRMAVGRLDARAHPPQRFGHTFHRALRQRRVARDLERPLLRREDADQQAHRRARVAAVERARGLAEPAQADAVHRQLVVVVLDIDAERTHRRDRRERVPRRAEPAHVRDAVAERADQNGAVRDRLVAGDSNVAEQRTGRLDAGHAHARGISSHMRHTSATVPGTVRATWRCPCDAFDAQIACRLRLLRGRPY